MNEKMTDEALSELLAHIRMELGHGAESDLGAHIAALTAERDEAAQRARIAAGAHVEAVKRSEHNEDVVKALRERLQALEAERDEWRERWRNGTGAILRRLAAIRQRAQETIDRNAENGNTQPVVADAARYILGEDARPLAPPEAFTHEKGLDAGVFEEAAKGCGLCPGCTDENWADGDLCDAATVRDMERTDYKAPPAMDVLSTPTATDPTTSEAFAFLREDAAYLRRGHPHTVGRMERMLSLLERRMGAMERAIRLRLEAKTVSDVKAAHNAMRSALTDAPLVFTLEDSADPLKERLARRGMTARELAATLDVTEETVSRWSTGRLSPSRVSSLAIEHVLTALRK